MTRRGVHVLASLDGAALDDRDLRALGLEDARHVVVLDGCRLAIGDDDPRAIDRSAAAGDFVAILGYFDEREALADRLGLPRDTQPATLARAALDRFGREVAAQADGEWTIVRWQAAERVLTLAASSGLRDVVLHAADRRRVAVSADIAALVLVRGVDAGLDPLGVVLPLARAPLRRALDDQTIRRGVRQLTAGETIRFAAAGAMRAFAAPVVPTPWEGDRGEALVAIETLLRRIVRGHLDRHGDVAFLLSGGLDSSLLTWLGAEERRAGQTITALTSAAAPDSGIADETGIARVVADALGIPMRAVRPAIDANAYRVDPADGESAHRAAASLYHYLYGALRRAALAIGADALVDGGNGELTVSGMPLSSAGGGMWGGVRDALGEMRRGVMERRGRGRWPLDAFHVQLAPTLAGALPDALIDAWRTPIPGPPRAGGVPWGVRSGVVKQADRATASGLAGLRHLDPFRDRRLIRLVAGMPSAYLHHEGQSRALARSLMAGRLPEVIVRRARGLPFSPDYYQRLRIDAPLAEARLPVFRAHGVDAWLDIDWLEVSLRTLASDQLMPGFAPERTQLTALAAEFLLGAINPSA